jgi:hypothetical protein
MTSQRKPPRKFPKYQHRASKQQERRTTKRVLSIWEICKMCADQMFGGPRCFTHNPTPEMRETNSSTTTTPTTTIWEELKFAFEDEINDWP